MEDIGRGVPASSFEARADEPHTAAAVARGVDAHAVDAAGAERLECRVLPALRFEQQPLRAVFRDSSFAADDSKINVTEIFKNLSPDTKVKVI